MRTALVAAFLPRSLCPSGKRRFRPVDLEDLSAGLDPATGPRQPSVRAHFFERRVRHLELCFERDPQRGPRRVRPLGEGLEVRLRGRPVPRRIREMAEHEPSMNSIGDTEMKTTPTTTLSRRLAMEVWPRK